MTRPFATIGFTMLFALYILNTVNTKAAEVILLIALAAFCVFLFFRGTRRNGALPLAAFTVAVCCVLSVFTVKNTQKNTEIYYDKTINIYGKVVDLPYTDNGRTYYTVKTEKINGFDNCQKIRISSKYDLSAKPLDYIEGSFKAYKIGSSDKDMSDYYKAKGCFLGAYTYDYDSITVTESEGFHPYAEVLKLKGEILQAVNTALPNEYGALLTGLLLGIKTSVSQKTLNAFSLIGSYHLLAVSGLHITVWTSFLYELLSIFNIKRKKRAIFSISFAVFFMALTGFNPPVVRAGILIIFSFAGMLFKREADSYNSIGLAVALMLLINPYASLSVSLWLSVFAAIGIIFLGSKLCDRASNIKIKNNILKKAVVFVLQSFSVTASAVLFTLPLNILVFDRFSLISPVSNLILITLSSLAMLFSGLAVLFYLLKLKFIALPLFLAAGGLSKVITKIAVSLSQFSFATISSKNIGLCVWTVLLIFVFSMFLLFPPKRKNKVKSTAVFFAVSLAVVCVVGAYTEKQTLKVTVVSVGNGSATVISDNGENSLIGCGGNYFSSSSVCDILSKEGAHNLKFVYIPRTNPTESSALDFVNERYDIMTLKEYETGEAILSERVKAECENEYAFITAENTTFLIVFTPSFDIASLPEKYKTADFLISRAALPKNFESGFFTNVILSTTAEKAEYEANKTKLMSTSDGSISIEVKQDGRTKIKRTA